MDIICVCYQDPEVLLHQELVALQGLDPGPDGEGEAPAPGLEPEPEMTEEEEERMNILFGELEEGLLERIRDNSDDD